MNRTEIELNRDEKKKEADKPPRAPRFSPPSVEEVAAYCQERRNHINPQQFIDFYSSKNWMVGRNKMKDWRASIRTWERRDSESTAPVVKQPDYTAGSEDFL